VPSKLSTTPSEPPPPEPSGSKRIQSKRATGTVGASADRAVGPIFGSANAASETGRPTGVNVVPSYEYAAVRFSPSEVSRT
jgi:hypothetical protein